VSRNGSSYVAIAATTNDAPESSPAKWSLMAQKGDTGATGSQGVQGPQGPAGADATNLWAVVNSNGTLARGQGVDSVTRTAAGRYRVDFNQNVSNCAYSSIVAQSGTGVPASFTGITQPGGDSTGTDRVMVYTWSAANGSATDMPFHLIVLC
jgi:hypothetical protein